MDLWVIGCPHGHETWILGILRREMIMLVDSRVTPLLNLNLSKSNSSVSNRKAPALRQYVPANDQLLREIHSDYTAWHRFKAYFQRTTELEKQIENIKNEGASGFRDKKVDITIAALEAQEYPRMKAALRQIVAKFNSVEKMALFESVVQKYLKGDHIILQRCLSLFTMDELTAMANEIIIKEQWKEDVDEAIRNISLSADHSALLHLEEEYSVGQFISRVINTVIMAFSFFEIGREPASSWEASHFLQIYSQIFGIPLLLLGVIASLITNPAIAVLTTVSILIVVIGAVALYLKYRKPVIENNSYLQNLTLEAQKGKLPPVVARDDIFIDLKNYLAAGGLGSRMHTILVGLSGAGKTEVIKGFAQYLLNNNDVPECLKGKQVIRIDTSEMLNSSVNFGKDKFELIIDYLLKHKNKFIIAFDNFHAVLDPKFRALTESRFCELFDANSDRSLPYFFTVTTDKKYNAFMRPGSKGDDGSIFQRLKKPLEVPPTTDAQTRLILQSMVRQQKLEGVSDGALTKIIELTTERMSQRVQPGISTDILTSAIANINGKYTQVTKEKELHALELEFEQAKNSYNPYAKLQNEIDAKEGQKNSLKIKSLSTLQVDVNAKRDEVNKERAGLENLRSLKKNREVLKTKIAQLARQKHDKNPAAKKEFIAFHYFVLPLQDKRIKEQMNKLGLCLEINEKLIEALVPLETARIGHDGYSSEDVETEQKEKDASSTQ